MVPDAARHAGFAPELPISWITADQLRSPGGRLGLSVLPGKRGASERYPGMTYRRDLSADIALLRAAGVRRLILLVEDHELMRWSEPDIVAVALGMGFEVIRHPIPDGAPPASVAELRRILEDVDAGRRLGDVVVACMGGVGRSGTIAACALVAGGNSADGAIALVREVRHPTAVETAEQVEFVRAFAREESDRAQSSAT